MRTAFSEYGPTAEISRTVLIQTQHSPAQQLSWLYSSARCFLSLLFVLVTGVFWIEYLQVGLQPL